MDSFFFPQKKQKHLRLISKKVLYLKTLLKWINIIQFTFLNTDTWIKTCKDGLKKSTCQCRGHAFKSRSRKTPRPARRPSLCTTIDAAGRSPPRKTGKGPCVATKTQHSQRENKINEFFKRPTKEVSEVQFWKLTMVTLRHWNFLYKLMSKVSLWNRIMK